LDFAYIVLLDSLISGESASMVFTRPFVVVVLCESSRATGGGAGSTRIQDSFALIQPTLDLDSVVWFDSLIFGESGYTISTRLYVVVIFGESPVVVMVVVMLAMLVVHEHQIHTHAATLTSHECI
jgi:hypothetical protein